MIALALVAAALAADPVIDALGDELERSVGELSLPDAEPPYFVAYRLWDVHDVSITAQLGGVLSQAEQSGRQLGVEVRVGSPEADDSNFDSFDDGVRSETLVIDDDPIAVRHDAWLATDQAYKGAVETLAAKQAAMRRKAEVDDLPDFVPGPPQQAVAATPERPDSQALYTRVRALSAVFLEHPGVEFSTAWGRSTTGRRAALDTLGTSVVQPVQQTVVVVAGRARADDGTTMVDEVSWVVKRPGDLPPLDVMRTAVQGLAARLAAWRDLPALEQEYIGPVLFEGDAALAMVRHLLLPSLRGTPPEEEAPRGSRVVMWDDSASGGPMRVKRRILPSGFDLVDDPTAHPGRPSSFAYDDEGEPARRVQLVSDGVIRAHLMSRTPNSSVQGSTGHGRGDVGDLVRAMEANPTLTAQRTASPRRLHRQAVKLAEEYDLDHYVVVRRLSHPALEGLSGGPMFTARSFFGFDDDSGLTAPVEVVRVYADGREEAFRGAALVGVDTRSLRDIVAAGASHTRTVLVPAPQDAASITGGEPVTVTAPDLLLGEAELAPSKADAERPPELPSPLVQGPTEGGG